MGTYTISTILGDITVYQGVAPHAHQLKNRNKMKFRSNKIKNS